MTSAPAISVNALAGRCLDRLVRDAALLRVEIARGSRGELLVDAGRGAPGGIAAGLRIAEICMGGLVPARLSDSGSAHAPFKLTTRTNNPVIACLASQYAGWTLRMARGGQIFRARLRARRGRSRAKSRCSPISATPTQPIAPSLCSKASGRRRPTSSTMSRANCGVATESLTFIYAPTQSLAGSVQIIARVLEVALHKAHELHFPLARHHRRARLRRRFRRRIPISSPRWDAPTMRSSMADRCIFS